MPMEEPGRLTEGLPTTEKEKLCSTCRTRRRDNGDSGQERGHRALRPHAEAEKAVRDLQKSGFDMRKLSIVGKDYHPDEDVVGYYTTGDRVKARSKTGAFWGGLWELLFGFAFFLIPGIGPLVVAGPLVAWIVGALEGTVIVGALSALGAGLYSIGIPKDSLLEYEKHIKMGQYLVIAHGATAEVSKTGGALAATRHQGVKTYACCA